MPKIKKRVKECNNKKRATNKGSFFTPSMSLPKGGGTIRGTDENR
jgi:hypothetical protein